jgi:hypothetical protein
MWIGNKGRGNSNLINHLIKRHSYSADQVETRSYKKRKTIETGKIQSTLKEYKATSSTNMNNQLIRMIASTGSSFRIVDDPEFKEFVRLNQQCSSSYQLPSKSTVTRTLLPNTYEAYSKMMLEKIQKECIAGALTTDCWTDRAVRGFITWTLHFIDDDFNLITCIID